jgi:hypothetical protein
VPLGSCVLRPLTGRCRVNFRRRAQCPLGSYVFRKRCARPSLFRLPFCSRHHAARRLPVRRSSLHRPSPVRNTIARAPQPAARRSRRLLARPTPAHPTRHRRSGLHRRRRPGLHRRPGPCARLLLGCTAASLPPVARAPRRSRLLGHPATAAHRFTVSSLQVTTSECLYLFFY